MPDIKRYTIYILIVFAVFTVFLSFAGYFNIGLLSDDYIDINGAVHSSLADKLTGNMPFTNSYHLRTTAYLSLESSNYLHNRLGFKYDDFLLYRIQNLLLYLILAYIAGRIILLLTGHLSLAVLTGLTVIIFPNNINNICWTVARVDLLCGIFYLMAIYFALSHLKKNDQTSFLSCILSFILALLTKETAVTIPVITAIFIFIIYGKKILLKKKMLILVQLGLILVYIFYKLAVLHNNIGEMLTMYQSSPFENAPGILARAAISLSIPLDYLSLNVMLREKNHLLMIYMASLYGAMFYLVTVMVRNEIYKYIGYISLSVLVLLLPNIYIGYIRTQMILIPFTILCIMLFRAYHCQLEKSIHINKLLLKIFFVAAICYWGYTGFENVKDWNFAYTNAELEIKELLKTGISPDSQTIIIGNPGRYKQAFLFDNLTGAYSYWKNKDFIITDTINDIVQTGALDEASVKAKLDCKQTAPGEFEIAATTPGQYFYIVGYDNEKIKEGFKNKDMSVEFKDYNILNKPTKLNLKILKPGTKCFIGGELKYTRIY